MIDSLLQFLLEEVAMDGDAGTSVAALAEFIRQFYARVASKSGVDQHPIASTSTSPAPDAEASAQKVDDAFVSFVWSALIDQPDVRVGVLRRVQAKPKNEEGTNDPAGAGPSSQPAPTDGEAGVEGSQPPVPVETAVKKGKKKKVDRKAQGPTHEMQILGEDERDLGRDALVERYGDKLRVLAGEETTWVAITGSHARPTSLTPTIYAVLQMISRGREEGTTAVRISKETGIDPKSVFHYLKIPQQLGIIKKFRDTDEGRWTNRALHVRYLSTSPYWAVHIQTEPDALKEEEADEQDEAALDEEGAVGQWDGFEMSPISPLYLTANKEMIRRRVVNALKRRKDRWMPQFDLHSAIGLHAATSLNLRRLNAIVTTLAQKGIVEKINVTKRKSGGREVTIQALRLRDPDELREAAAEGSDAETWQQALQEVERDDEDDGSYPVAMRTIERQVLDLLMNAGSRGVTNYEISAALGNFSLRFVDSILQKLGRCTPPPPLADFTIHSLHETVGRLKQTRWFSLVGYLSFRRSRGFPDEPMEEEWRRIVEGGQLGQWADDVAEGPREGQYATAAERQQELSQWHMWAYAGDAAEAAALAKSKRRKSSKADGAAEDEEPTPQKPAKKKGPIGRPRKNPLKEGEESAYMRKKREKAEDEERARLGLPPIERWTKRGRKQKAEVAEAEDAQVEADSSTPRPAESVQPADSGQPTEDGQPEGSGQPAESGQAATSGSAAAGDGVRSDQTGGGSSAQKPPPKKRGRPPKKKITVPAQAEEALASTSGPSPAGAETDSREAATPIGKQESGRLSRRGLFATSKTPSDSAKRKAIASGPSIEIVLGSPRKRLKRAVSGASEKQGSRSQHPATTSPVSEDQPASSLPAQARAPAPLPVAGTEDTDQAAPLPGPDIDAAAGASALPMISEISDMQAPAGDATEEGADIPLPTPPSSSPAIARNVAPTGTADAATPSRFAAPAAKKRKSRASRASVVNRLNLTQLARQREVLDYIAAEGGLVEWYHKLNEAVHAWGSAQTPPVSQYQMDKHSLDVVLEAAVNTDLLRKTVVVGSKGERRDVYYLPSVDINSEASRAFLSGRAEPVRGNRFRTVKRVDGLFAESDEDELKDGGSGHRPKRVDVEDALADPEPGDGPDRVKEYLRAQQAVLGRMHGVRYGLVARARQLHTWLASYVFANADRPGQAVVRMDGNFLIVQQTMLDTMPVGVFVRVVPLPVESETLEQFLLVPTNHATPMRDLPNEVANIIRPRHRKRKAALWRVLELLLDLNLVSPSVLRATDRGTEEFAAPRSPKHASHWRVHVDAPLYALGDHKAPLIGTHSLQSNDDVSAFWSALRNTSTARHQEPVVGVAASGGLAPAYSGRSASRREFTSQARWRDAYQLSPIQRGFLCKLEEVDPAILDDDRNSDLERWASSLYAPPEVVRRYLTDVRDGKAAAVDAGRKRRRVRHGRGEHEGSQLDVMSEDEQPRESAVAVMARKRREAADQQEQDWHGILARFRRDHQQPELDQIVVDWLHKKFVDPRPGNKLDAKQLDFELRRLLPPAEGIAEVPAEDRQTLVPLSVQRKARKAKNPYAVTRQPNIGVRAVKARSLKVKQQRERRAHALPRAPPRFPAPDVSASLVATDGDNGGTSTLADQSAFLQNPLPPYPKLPLGKRVPRSHFSTEHDELLLDAEIVIQVRARAINTRVHFAALEWFFPGNEGSVLAKRIRTILKRLSDKMLHERMTTAFTAVYAAHKDAVLDPYPTSLVDFDLGAWIRILRDNVKRRQFRLMAAPEGVQMPIADELPSSLEDLDRHYHLVSDDRAVAPRRRFDKLWSRHHMATNLREDVAASLPFARAWVPDSSPKPSPRLQEQATSAFKAILATPEERYNEADGDALLAPFTAEVDKIVTELVDKDVIVQAAREETRRLPGRNFSYTDRFLKRFGARLELAQVQEASHFEQDLLGSSEGIFPLAPASGEMMAFFDLISTGKATLSVDTITLTEKALDNGDFTSRQANDDDIECTVNIVPASETQERSASSGSVLPKTIIESDQLASPEQVAEAESAPSEGDTLACALLRVVRQGGMDGTPVAHLMERAERSEKAAPDEIVSAISRLTDATPALAFFAGGSDLSLVSVQHFSEWALAIPPSDEQKAARPRFFLPALWTTVRGEVNVEHFQRAASWVKGELRFRGGLTLKHLADRASNYRLLSAYEIRTLLLTLRQAGQVICRLDPSRSTVDEVGLLEERLEEKEIDWTTDHWFTVGTFW